jgi:hypothetical protein
MNKCIICLQFLNKGSYSDSLLFIFISTIYIIKFFIYLYCKVVWAVVFASLIWIIT